MRPSACPTPGELDLFNRGRLSEEAFESLAGHLEACTVCQSAVACLADEADPWLVLLTQPATGSFYEAEARRQEADQTGATVPGRLDCYELLEVLGEGGMGVVYKARNVELGNVVAIKLFRRQRRSAVPEASIAAGLHHPNIVPVHLVGKHQGRPYYVMQLIEGRSLAHHLRGIRDGRSTARHQRWAAGLLAQVARAIHYAHQRGIIHRDLKPANVLPDGDGQPHVADFDLAKLIESEPCAFELGTPGESPAAPGSELPRHLPGAVTLQAEKGVIVGTPAYMSPEQAAGDGPTTGFDVYALGIILYEMLTGDVPFRGPTDEETLRLVRTQTPPAPRSVDARIDARLERICLKCLRKDPQQRYGSALALALELECWLTDRPITGDSRWQMLRLWCRRNPALAGLALTAILLLALVTTAAISVSRTLAARMEKEVLEGNAYAARGVASTVLLHLGQWRSTVYAISEDPELRQLLERYDREGLRRFLDKAIKGRNGLQFDDWILLNGEGVMSVGSGPGHSNGKYDLRDYFRGARGRAGQRGLESVYVSRTYRSSHDATYRIGIARAVRNDREPGRPWVLVASVRTDATMGVPRLHDDRRKAILVGPEDPNMGEVARNNFNAHLTIGLQNHPLAATSCLAWFLIPSDRGASFRFAADKYLILLHEGYKSGEEPVPISVEQLGPLAKDRGASQFSLPDAASGDFPRITDARYFDPVGERKPKFAGRWLAGRARVGNTGYVVGVQQNYEETIGRGVALARQVIVWGGIALSLVVILVGGALWFGTKRAIATPAPPEPSGRPRPSTG